MDLVAVISVSAAALVSVLGQLQHSKCTHIGCCCVECDRAVDPAATDTADTT